MEGAWKVAVESPDEDGNYLGILQAKDKAVITSADMRDTLRKWKEVSSYY